VWSVARVVVACRRVLEPDTVAAEPAASAAGVRAAGAERVILTDGDQGSVGFSAAGEVHRQAAYPARVVDTTGAGDAHHAAYLVASLRGVGLAAALDIASWVGARACECPGPRATIEVLEDCRKRLAEIGT
jgi:sugar/nucleoside kinase (ribokinase family)